MKKFFLVPVLASAILFSCKNQEDQNSTAKNAAVKDTVQNTDFGTYSELSIKEGGEWKGRKYEGGTFKNVDSVELPANHTDHSYFIRYEGPGWENKNIAYRLYLDWRNAIDIFGKRVDTLVLPHVGQDNFDSYHEASPWGQDILHSGKALGIGGFGRYMNDTVAHFRNVSKTFAKVHNNKENASVTINYKDWKTGEKTIDLEANISITPDDRYLKVELDPSKAIEGLTTGIVKVEGVPLIKKVSDSGKWAYIATYGTQTLVNETDKLGMAIFYKSDEVSKIVEGPDDHLLIFKPTSEEITYYPLAAWDEEKQGITSKEEFLNDLNQKLQVLDQTGSLNSKE
ncbi:DUF4861 domain-containing protein [Christiangramia fulva]|uniref:DUF4861 domain-containing protein n=1 Tax=Christiangramia fulva TaxID=2126553 RepID=A0A2R3Z5X7_9FLAO|nr:DUF4861 family protein [Christiangramia fulva]AVR45658.1 DUF4861 domain-containing protein [Christiangramia fulva]